MYTYKHTLHACYFGYITQAVVNNLAPLFFVIFMDEFGISFEMIGRLTLINFGTQIAVDFLTLKFADRIGYRKTLAAAHVFCAVGLISLGLLPMLLSSPYIGLLMAVISYAIGGGIIEVLVSPVVDSLPGEEKDSAMSLLHSFYCWGQMGVVLITTIIIKIFGSNIWFIIPVLWAIIPIYNLFKFLKVPLMPPVSEEEKISLRDLLKSRGFIIALILMMCAGAGESTMAQWSSLFAEKGLQVSKFTGDLLGPCLFAVFMGAGRTIYGIWGSKINLKAALIASGVLCIVCYCITVFTQIPIIALLGCALCGLSVSLMWPGTFSLTAEAYPKGGTAMFGILSVFGDIGCSIGPWLAGYVSDMVQKSGKFADYRMTYGLSIEQIGIKTGLFVAMIFPVIFLLGVIIQKKYSYFLFTDRSNER